jgi:hypothetical protein
MTTPNGMLRAVRMGMLMSQDDFARAIRESGRQAGVPNDANKRLVQRWESGTIIAPRPVYARALQSVTGLPIASLGFNMAPRPQRPAIDGRGPDGPAGSDQGRRPEDPGALPPATTGAGNYSGVWVSRYEYFSSGRSDTFTERHFVVLLQHGQRVTARSLPGSSDSSLSMDLTVDANVITGTWVEETASAGYYRGARYHGAIQLLVEPTGRRLAGKWIGFGKELEVNTGPWELNFEDASTSKATLAAYDRRP